MRYLSHVGLCVLAFQVGQNVWADQVAQKSMKILGKTVSVTQNLSSTEDAIPDETSQSGVESTSQVNLFGKKIEIVRNSVQYRVNENEGLSYDNKFYVKGKRVMSQSFIDGDGSYAYNVDIPYTEVAGDIFSYSLGILTLGVYSGVSYEGLLKSQVSSEFLKRDPARSADMNLVQASAEVDLLAKGFIEGQVKVLFIKGAVGGALNLIDGKAGASIAVTPMNVIHPEVAYGGLVNLLSGSLYGYVGSGSTKWYSYDFYKSKGYCYAFGSSSCQK